MLSITRRARAGASAALAVIGLLAAPGSAEFLLPPGCDDLAVSPEFDVDHTAACAGVIVVEGPDGFSAVGGITVAATVDGGRTWVQAPGAGVPADFYGDVQDLAFSPNYATDRTLYLSTVDGLFSSVTLGVAWTQVTSLPGGRLDGMTLWDAGGMTQIGLVAEEKTDEVVLAAPPAASVAAGSAADDRRLVVVPSTDFTAVMIAETSPSGDDNTTRRRVEAYSCDARLTCVERLHSWPVGTTVHQAGLLGDQRTVYVVTRSAQAGGPLSFWTSADLGRTWRPWASLDRAYRATRDPQAWTYVGLATSPKLPRRIYARLIHPQSGEVQSREVMFRSDDAGASWHRVFDSSRTPTPWLWPRSTQGDREGDIFLTGDGRLLLIAQQIEDQASGFQRLISKPFCSTDGARTWKASC